MNRNFALLGLSEDATKEQVAAYERRAQQYKSKNYADEPEYAARKLAELRQAYDEAYRVAGTSAAHTAPAETATRPVSRTVSEEPQPARRKAERNWDDEGSPKKNRKIELKKLPKFSELKESAKSRFDEIKETTKKNLAETADILFDGESEQENSSRRLDENGNITEVREPKPKIRRLDENGSGMVVESSESFGTSSSKKGGIDAKQAGTIITIILAVLSLGIGLFDSGDDFSDYDYDYSEPYVYESGYSYDYLTTDEDVAHEYAQDTNNYLYDEGVWSDSYSVRMSTESKLIEAADNFTQRYLKMESMEDTIAYLEENYPEFDLIENAANVEKVHQILEFYGFESYSYVEGIIDPFTDETIINEEKYLNFLNAYYDEYLSPRPVVPEEDR